MMRRPVRAEGASVQGVLDRFVVGWHAFWFGFFEPRGELRLCQIPESKYPWHREPGPLLIRLAAPGRLSDSSIYPSERSAKMVPSSSAAPARLSGYEPILLRRFSIA